MKSAGAARRSARGIMLSASKCASCTMAHFAVATTAAGRLYGRLDEKRQTQVRYASCAALCKLAAVRLYECTINEKGRCKTIHCCRGQPGRQRVWQLAVRRTAQLRPVDSSTVQVAQVRLTKGVTVLSLLSRPIRAQASKVHGTLHGINSLRTTSKKKQERKTVGNTPLTD